MNNLIFKKNLELQTIENIKNSKSINTNRAYKSDYNHFIEFCKKNDFDFLKPDVKTISVYLTDLSNKKFKYSTIRRRLVSLSLANKLNGNYINVKHPAIDENLKTIRRKLGNYQRGKKPILLEELREIIDTIENNKSNIRKIRDKSIILLGFAGGFRRSEIVSLDFEDIELVKEGMKVLLRKSKTDQFSNGFLKGIPYLNSNNLCAVTSLIKWINISKIKKGPLFRKISKSDKLLERRLTGQTVALIIKKYTEIAGINNINFSGHSLRSGFATVVASLGADERSIMNMTGHKSENMVRRYIRESNLFNNNALNKLSKL
jgi:site-specific recombinase XerD